MAEPRPLFPREPEGETVRIVPEEEEVTATGEPAYQAESLKNLTSELVADVGSLVRSELQLARTEIREELSVLVQGIALAAVGGLALFFGVTYLLLAAIFAIGQALPLSSSALIVGGVVFVIGLILVLLGVGRLRTAKPVPEQTIDSVREDVRWLRNKKP